MVKILFIAVALLITWQDNTGEEAGFEVSRTVDVSCQGEWNVVGYAGVNGQSFVDSAGQNLACYRVRAFNDTGFSAFSDVAQYVCSPPKAKRCRE